MTRDLLNRLAVFLKARLIDGIGVSYFELTQQLAEGYISPRLQEFSTYYSNRLSYEEVEKLVERVSKAEWH